MIDNFNGRLGAGEAPGDCFVQSRLKFTPVQRPGSPDDADAWSRVQSDAIANGEGGESGPRDVAGRAGHGRISKLNRVLNCGELRDGGLQVPGKDRGCWHLNARGGE